MISVTETSDSMPKYISLTASNTLVPLPSLAEHQRIVTKLNELRHLFEKLRRANDIIQYSRVTRLFLLTSRKTTIRS